MNVIFKNRFGAHLLQSLTNQFAKNLITNAMFSKDVLRPKCLIYVRTVSVPKTTTIVTKNIINVKIRTSRNVLMEFVEKAAHH